MHRYGDKDVQKDKKLMSYNIVDRGGKPNVEVKARLRPDVICYHGRGHHSFEDQ